MGPVVVCLAPGDCHFEQGFPGFQNMQYLPQMFQFPPQIPGIQPNPQFQQNQNSYTTECPIPSEPDVPSTTPTATSDSHAATTEQPVCPTSLTTNDAAGAHPKS